MSSNVYYVDNHVLFNAFTNRGAYYISCDNSPWILEQSNQLVNILTFDLFSSEKAASEYLEEMRDDNPGDFQVDYASDLELLRMVLNCGIVTIDSVPHALSFAGACIEQESHDEKIELATLDGLTSALIMEKSPHP